MNVIFTIILSLVISFLFVYLSKKLNISVVVGLIFSGLFIGYPLIKNFVLDENVNIIFFLGNIGLITLMFLAGMDVSWSLLYKEKKQSFYLAFLAFLTPFLLGLIIFLLLKFSLLASITIAICLSITAEASKARVLIELNKLKTKIGSLMMGAGIIDDIIGVSLFILISFLFVKKIESNELFIIGASLASFFIGIIINKFFHIKHIKHFEKFLFLFVVPFFFISIGINFNLQSIKLNPLLLIIIIIIATSGKIFGSLFVKYFTNFSFKQLYLVGWGMNSRGAVELAIAFIAFKIGLINNNLYSSLVVMALVTTLIFPFFFRRIVRKNPKIMN